MYSFLSFPPLLFVLVSVILSLISSPHFLPVLFCFFYFSLRSLALCLHASLWTTTNQSFDSNLHNQFPHGESLSDMKNMWKSEEAHKARQERRATRVHFPMQLPDGLKVQKGDELACFRLGSTVVLVFDAPEDFRFRVRAGDTVRMGQNIGTI